MGFYDFSIGEITLVKVEFPKLEYIKPGRWKGIVDFDHVYKDYRIIGRYKVAIAVPENYPNAFPIVFDSDRHTERIAEKHGITDLRDLHCNPKDNSVCLCVPQEEKARFPSGSGMGYFINNLVTPYFYGLFFRDERGHWPWREYSHGVLGILEHHAENSKVQTKEDIEFIASFFCRENNWRKHRQQMKDKEKPKACLCGSGKLFPNCHSLAWRGLIRLGDDIQRLNLNSYKLFSRTK